MSIEMISCVLSSICLALISIIHLQKNFIPSFQIFSHTMALCLVTQLCLTLWDAMDYNPLDSSVHGILQAGILEWVAMHSSRGSSQPREWSHVFWVSCITDEFFTTEPLGKAPMALSESRGKCGIFFYPIVKE